MTHASDIARLIQLNAGQLIGKTRLQKSAYFLEATGAGFGFDFSYYHFGPYSEELSDSSDDAHALGLIDIDWKTSQEGTRYAIFRCTAHDHPQDHLDPRRIEILDVLKNYSTIELELAATAKFLERNGYASDPWSETRRRKAAKVTPEREARASQLLSELASL